jgi:hypothetical protein
LLHQAALRALGAEAASSLMVDEHPGTKAGIGGAACLGLGNALERIGRFAPSTPHPKALRAPVVDVTSLS